MAVSGSEEKMAPNFPKSIQRVKKMFLFPIFIYFILFSEKSRNGPQESPAVSPISGGGGEGVGVDLRFWGDDSVTDAAPGQLYAGLI